MFAVIASVDGVPVDVVLAETQEAAWQIEDALQALRPTGPDRVDVVTVGDLAQVTENFAFVEE